MLLTIDIAAGMVEHAVEVAALGTTDVAIGFGVPFVATDSSLLGFEARGFATGQLAATHALADALLFAMLATVNVRRVRERGDAESDDQHRRRRKANNLLHTFPLRFPRSSPLTLDKTSRAARRSEKSR